MKAGLLLLAVVILPACVDSLVTGLEALARAVGL